MEKDQIIYTIISFCVFVFLLSIALFLIFALYIQSKKRLVLENKVIKEELESTVRIAKVEIQEQTLDQVSREIHDNIGQVLSLARLNLSHLEDGYDLNRIRFTDDLIGNAIGDLRNLSHMLNNTFLKKEGLIKSLNKLILSIKNTGKLEVFMKTEAPVYYLDENKLIIVFRTVQEIFANIIKHADAKVIYIDIKGESSLIEICIKDDGKGFDTSVLESNMGSGLLSIRERMLIADGFLNIESIPGNGTTVSLKFNTR